VRNGNEKEDAKAPKADYRRKHINAVDDFSLVAPLCNKESLIVPLDRSRSFGFVV
jgi:hypothetical protein